MASTVYTDFQDPPVSAAWLNDVNVAIYTALGAAGVAPATAADIITNLALVTLSDSQTVSNKILNSASLNSPVVNAGLISLARIVYKRTTVTYSPSMTINAGLGNYFHIAAVDAVAFTINAPTNPSEGQPITINLRNESAGALGAVTWDATFRMSAWTQPATGFNRSITFLYNGTNWVQASQTGVDVPN